MQGSWWESCSGVGDADRDLTSSDSDNHGVLASPHGSNLVHRRPFMRKPLHVVWEQEHLSTSSMIQESDPSFSHGPHHRVIHRDDHYLDQDGDGIMMMPTQRAQTPDDPDDESHDHESHGKGRHLSLWDLIAIGVGGTIGSGIFALTGMIAVHDAGPATFVSFAIAGCAATLSGVAYAELASHIPAAGSTYVYAYVCLGEVVAVVAAACLTLEYAVAGAAVARSWGDKLVLSLGNLFRNQDSNTSDTPWFIEWFLVPFGGAINVPAGVISAVSTYLLILGVKESKAVTNAVTLAKMAIVVFMITVGLALSLSTPAPSSSLKFAPYGVKGVFRGATSSFFGYLGYDEVCVVAGESKNPARDLPRAVLGTLLIVTTCYLLAAYALTSMVPNVTTDIGDGTSGFPSAFYYRHADWAGHITSLGELLTLPVVVLVSMMAQPRVTLGMARDGLVPPSLGYIDGRGVIYYGTLLTGVVMTLTSAFIPFEALDDLVSTGILLAFSISNSCLVLLRCETPPGIPPYRLPHLLALYNAGCFLTSVSISHDGWVQHLPWGFSRVPAIVYGTLAGAGTLTTLLFLCHQFPSSPRFGGSILTPASLAMVSGMNHNNGVSSDTFFRTPFVPQLPCAGMAVNWYLVSQLTMSGIFYLVIYIVVVILLYWKFSAPHSFGLQQAWATRIVDSTDRNGSLETTAASRTDTNCAVDRFSQSGYSVVASALEEEAIT
jgi:basic amino acid/polyamine antiporter, APA family